jgi:hypothetical protein
MQGCVAKGCGRNISRVPCQLAVFFPENGGPSKRAGLILRRKGIVQAYFYRIPETE